MRGVVGMAHVDAEGVGPARISLRSSPDRAGRAKRCQDLDLAAARIELCDCEDFSLSDPGSLWPWLMANQENPNRMDP
jgi:hypothetical protein